MWRNWTVNTLRLLLGGIYIFSGFVKAIDPMGTTYKIGEYMQAMGLVELSHSSLPKWIAISLIAIEFLLGTNLFIGIRRGWTTFWAVVMMLFMTGVSSYAYFFNPVSDCGCFGDAVKLSNAQTALKNIPLLLVQLWVWWEHKRIIPFVTQRNMPIISLYNFLFIIGFCVLSIHYLPLIDFRPYKIGADIRKGRILPENAKMPIYESSFVYSKNGQQQTFELKNLPDSTWTFVDSKSILVEEGDKPLMTDFNVVQVSSEGNVEVTDQLLSDSSYTFILISPYLEHADVASHDQINTIYDWATDHKYSFICLTASNQAVIEHWREHTGAAYDFYLADEKLLKTIVRSNPGLLLLKDGVIQNKWSTNNLPDGDDITPTLTVEPNNNTITLGKIVLWYVLLLIIAIALDRTYIATKLHKRFFRKYKSTKRSIESSPSADTTTYN